MGLFSKKKEQKENSMPQAPPQPQQSPSGNNNSSVPPAPNTSQGNQMANQSQSNNSAMPPSPNSSNSQNGTGMPQPPEPSGGLDDIKSQINTKNEVSVPNTSVSQGNTQQNTEENNNDLDSLFDLSEIEQQLPTSNNKNQEENSSDKEESHNNENLKFLKTKHENHKNETNDNIYITTSQFKTLLEIVEDVKTKTKDSSERHLRLLDIKSEEDIEFENLKKDFTYIEDKLYEVDNLIFER